MVFGCVCEFLLFISGWVFNHFSALISKCRHFAVKRPTFTHAGEIHFTDTFKVPYPHIKHRELHNSRAFTLYSLLFFQLLSISANATSHPQSIARIQMSNHIRPDGWKPFLWNIVPWMWKGGQLIGTAKYISEGETLFLSHRKVIHISGARTYFTVLSRCVMR